MIIKTAIAALLLSFSTTTAPQGLGSCSIEIPPLCISGKYLCICDQQNNCRYVCIAAN